MSDPLKEYGKDSLARRRAGGKNKRKARYAGIVFVEVLAVCAFLFLVAAGTFMWRLSQGPVPLDFATEYIEKSLSSGDSPYKAEIGGVVFDWPDFSRSPDFLLKDLRVLKEDRILLAVPEIAATLSRRDLVFGKFYPKGFSLKEPSLKVLRTQGNKFYLDIEEDQPEVLPDAGQEGNAAFLARLLQTLAGGDAQAPQGPLKRLRRFEIENAKLVVEDRMQNISWVVPDIDLALRRTRSGLRLRTDFLIPAALGKAERISVKQQERREGQDLPVKEGRVDAPDLAALSVPLTLDMRMRRDGAGGLNVEIELEDGNLAALLQKLAPATEKIEMERHAPFDAKFELGLDSSLHIRTAEARLESSHGKVYLPSYYDTPLSYQHLYIRTQYSRDSGLLDVKRFSLTLGDVPLSAAATFDLSYQERGEPAPVLSKTERESSVRKLQSVEGDILLSVSNTTIKDFQAIYPRNIPDSALRRWVFDKITNASITNLQGRIGLVLQQNPDAASNEARLEPEPKDLEAEKTESEPDSEEGNVQAGTGEDQEGAAKGQGEKSKKRDTATSLTYGDSRQNSSQKDTLAKNVPMHSPSSEGDRNGWQIQLSDPVASFDFTDLDLDYQNPLLPLYEAAGHFSLSNEILDIDVESGKLGDIAVREGRVTVSDLFTTNKGAVNIEASLAGQLVHVIDYLNVERIKRNINYDFPRDRIKGEANIDLNLTFPTSENMKAQDMDFEVKGRVEDGRWPDIISGMALAGGPFEVKVTSRDIQVQGKGTLGSAKADILWHQFFSAPDTKELQEAISSSSEKKEKKALQDESYMSKVDATLYSDDEFRSKLGVDLEPYLTGPIALDIHYRSFFDDTALAKVQANLEKAHIFLPPLGHEQIGGAGATLNLEALFAGENLRAVENIDLKAEELSLGSGRLSFIPVNGKVEVSAGWFENISAGESRIREAGFEVTPDKLLKIKIMGPYLDARHYFRSETPPQVEGAQRKDVIAPANDNADGQGEKADSPKAEEDTHADIAHAEVTQDVVTGHPSEISLAFEQVRTHKEYHLNKVKLYATLNAQGDFTRLESDAAVGEGQIYLRYKPAFMGAGSATGSSEGQADHHMQQEASSSNKPAAEAEKKFHLTVTDAGAALKAFNIYKDIEGGEIVATATPITSASEGNFRGKVSLHNFRIVKAPVLARLFGALSLPGLTQLLENEGMRFSRLESDFKWLYQPGGGRISLKNGRTSGNSLGLTFEGIVNLATSYIDLAGTLIPVSGLNSLVSNIPLIGDVITGRKGEGIFAVAYRVRGNLKNPDVSVNPLSALAPGFLRDIFFAGKPEDPTLQPVPDASATKDHSQDRDVKRKRADDEADRALSGSKQKR